MVSHTSSGGLKPYFEEFLSALKVLNGEDSGRGVVLAAVAMLDDILKKCIRAFLIEGESAELLLNGLNAPLGSLSARILSAYSLGLLSKAEYEECRRLQKVRNLFAHSVHISFSDDSVIDLCGNLNLYAKQNDHTRKHPRAKFEIAAVGVILVLTARQEVIATRRLKYSEWPLQSHLSEMQ